MDIMDSIMNIPTFEVVDIINIIPTFNILFVFFLYPPSQKHQQKAMEVGPWLISHVKSRDFPGAEAAPVPTCPWPMPRFHCVVCWNTAR